MTTINFLTRSGMGKGMPSNLLGFECLFFFYISLFDDPHVTKGNM